MRGQLTRKTSTLMMALLVAVTACNGNSQEISQAERANLDSLRHQTLDEDWYYQGWTSEQFTGNNKPFHEIRMGLRRLIKRNALRVKLPLFEKEARADPYNSKLQFRWVMTALELYDRKKSNPIGQPSDGSLSKWRDALSFASQPKAYDYTRLRFLITTENAMTMGKYASDERLKNVGKRLLKIQPKDKFVSYWVRQLMSYSSSLEDKYENLRYARQLVKAKPKDSNAQSELAGSYLDLWMVTKRRSHANTAIAQYKKWLQMAPKNDPFRPNAEHWIKAIPKGQAFWEKQGTGRTD